ncbi:serine carboxypeptidase [Trifolium repens]|nr:serine carboxypeptidase [Trifolium repens]
MIHIHIRSGIFAAIAICIVLLAYYLSQQSIDLELPVSYLPLQGSEADKVIRLPDQPQVDFQQFAGYITVDEVNQRNLFYYFVESEVDPVSKPVVLWLSGGPGCSSIGEGAFTEHGPFQPTRKGGLVKNRYSWNRVANMLYLESPVGVGFSYSANTSDYFMVTDERTARDALVFLQGWFTRFQKYQNNDVFITGVSYAGHWAPQIAELILQTKPSFNLKGIAMGNPLLDFTTDYNSRAQFLWTHGLISVETYGLLRTVCNYAQIMRENINGTLSTDCARVFHQFSQEVGRYVDAFNIIEDICLPSEFELFNETPIDDGEKRDVCVERETPSYMNRGEVREAIHAKLVGITKWTMCSNVLIYNRKNFEDPVIPLLGRLVKSGVRVMVYSGDQDAYIPLTGTQSLLQGLAKEIGLDSESYRSWFDGPQVAGGTQTYGDNLTFATIRGGGHAAASSQPSRSLRLFKSFIEGKPLPVNKTRPF